MSYFMPAPKIVLKTMEDVKSAIALDREDYGDLRYGVRSDWLVSIIKEVKASGEFPYNAVIKKAASEELGLPVSDYSNEGDMLSLLIYNAQQYARSDACCEAGYEPLTQALIERAFHSKMKIECLGDSVLGQNRSTFTPRNVKGVIRAMLPKSRKYHTPPQGQPARLVK